MTNEELTRQVIYLNAKINALTAAVAIPLAAFPTRTEDGKDLSGLLGEMVKKMSKGRTEHTAARHDGARDALTRLSRLVDKMSDSVTTTIQPGD